MYLRFRDFVEEMLFSLSMRANKPLTAEGERAVADLRNQGASEADIRILRMDRMIGQGGEVKLARAHRWLPSLGYLTRLLVIFSGLLLFLLVILAPSANILLQLLLAAGVVVLSAGFDVAFSMFMIRPRNVAKTLGIPWA